MVKETTKNSQLSKSMRETPISKRSHGIRINAFFLDGSRAQIIISGPWAQDIPTMGDSRTFELWEYVRDIFETKCASAYACYAELVIAEY